MLSFGVKIIFFDKLLNISKKDFEEQINMFRDTENLNHIRVHLLYLSGKPTPSKLE